MLATKGLTLHYGGSQILYGIDMQARAGEVTCIMGTNGVGKTSLLKALAGTHPRSGGQVILAGEDLPPLPPPNTTAMTRFMTWFRSSKTWGTVGVAICRAASNNSLLSRGP